MLIRTMSYMSVIFNLLNIDLIHKAPYFENEFIRKKKFFFQKNLSYCNSKLRLKKFYCNR